MIGPFHLYNAERGPYKTGPSKRGLIARWLSLLVVSAFLSGLTVFGLELLFSPYRRLPINGMINGNLYTWGHLVRNNRYGFRERDFETPKPADI